MLPARLGDRQRTGEDSLQRVARRQPTLDLIHLLEYGAARLLDRIQEKLLLRGIVMDDATKAASRRGGDSSKRESLESTLREHMECRRGH